MPAGAIGLLLAVALCALAHVSAMALAGRALGVALEEMSFGLGPRLLRVGKLSIRLLPLGGAVRFQTAADAMPEWEEDDDDAHPASADHLHDARGRATQDLETLNDPVLSRQPMDGVPLDRQPLDRQPLAAQLLIGASGCLVLIALACALLGGAAGFQALADGFAHIVGGALSPLHTAQDLLARVDAAAHGLPFVTLLGLAAATTAAFNLLPLPGANGGYLLGALGQRLGLAARWPASWTQALLLAYLALAASWLFAAAMYLAR
ncbi:site-2 protease family protein [Achromobacter sp.]|uniref:site-2 protease family protein n=1 Tax=Achromobacter sp. TaxID=134375 RepID=UPI0028A80FD3|nr:site-2 protease family protein [Achromobacter sp.]